MDAQARRSTVRGMKSQASNQLTPSFSEQRAFKKQHKQHTTLEQPTLHEQTTMEPRNSNPIITR
eukprot:5042441-Amphidinium_carterae.1